MLKPGSFIGDRYEIISIIGNGGMSEVYKAKCHKLNRFVAIKVLKEEFAMDKSFVTKFKTEAQSVAGLIHPNIVNVYDVGDDNGNYYIVMEYVEGITLKQYIERKKQLAVKEAVSIAIQVAQGMEVAHNNHIVHRDIKPQNILISREGKVKVTDFGIARVATANTINANTVGSVHYISPEQARGGFVDERSDIYSLGITLYEMITGQVPFDGESTVSIALKHIQEEIVPANELVPSLPISIAKIIEKCTQKKPDRRYLKVSSLIADLKKSLIMPNEDFVMIVPDSNNAETVMLSEDEVSAIKKEASKPVYDDSDEEYDEDDEEYDEDEEEFENSKGFLGKINPKIDKLVMIGGIAAAAIVLIILIVIFATQVGGGCSGTTNNQSTTKAEETEKIKMPDVVGLSVEDDDVEGILEEAGLKVKFEYKESNTVESGFVISQSVDADTEVKKGTTITVVVSSGAEEIEITDVVGKTKDEAVSELKALGFNTKIEAEYNDAKINEVIKTDPSAGEKAKYGDTITITVSRGPETSNEAVVPNLKGLTKEKAEQALVAAGLVLGKVEESETTNSADYGKVIWQQYEYSSSYPKGTAVNIVIGKEKAVTYSGSIKIENLVTNSELGLVSGTKQDVKIVIKIKNSAGTYFNEISKTVNTDDVSEIPASVDFNNLTQEPKSADIIFPVE